MFTQSIRRAGAILIAALLSAASLMASQPQTPALKITRPAIDERFYTREGHLPEMDGNSADIGFRRAGLPSNPEHSRNRERVALASTSGFGVTRGSASLPALLSLGTGGGDIDEAEPNDLIAQAVSLPVNLFGEVSFTRDVDFFAFRALAGQNITIEAFAARLRRSELIADIGLFDSAGQLLGAAVGDVDTDPLIRFVSPIDQDLIVGITDAEDIGGSSFDYILNITRGTDTDEQEPNGQNAQLLPDLPQTVFGEISGRNDVDFYSFTASAGQTLIVDIDAEVLGSGLDPEINVINPDGGIELFYNDQHDGDDPRFNIVLPYTGRYVIGVGAFTGNSSGFYRLNASLVTSIGAPQVSAVTRISKKLMEVTGSGFTAGSVVEVDGFARVTTVIDSTTLRAKVKTRAGEVVTVANPPDERRSNPLVVQ